VTASTRREAARGGLGGSPPEDNTVTVVSPSGSSGATVELPAEIFAAKVNVPLIHQVVVAQQAAARQGTHSARNRGAVRGGGKKPYRQKGTGRARQGSTRAPQFAGGGTVHGPVPRSYEQRTPKKMKAAALRGALSDRAAHGRVHVVSGFTDEETPRTRDALAVLETVIGTGPGQAHVLVVAAADDPLTWKSLRNVRGVHLIAAGQLNTYDVLVSDHVVFTEAALDQFVSRYAELAPRRGVEGGSAPLGQTQSGSAVTAAEPEDVVEPADAEPEDSTAEPEDSVESPEPEDAS
jgi:large subunit ribosomal protein L4